MSLLFESNNFFTFFKIMLIGVDFDFLFIFFRRWIRRIQGRTTPTGKRLFWVTNQINKTLQGSRLLVGET